MIKIGVLIGVIIVLSIFSVVLVTSQQGNGGFSGVVTALEGIRDAILGISAPECEFEKFSQSFVFEEIELPIEDSMLLQLPEELAYGDINFLDGLLSWRCSVDNPSNESVNQYCNIHVNNNTCISLEDFETEFPQNLIQVSELSNECLSYFEGGNNIIRLERVNNTIGELFNLYMEMDIRPANC